MRVLLLATLAATAFGHNHLGATVCGQECVSALFTKVAEAVTGGLDYVDGDLAVYTYMLYVSYTHGDSELEYVDTILTQMATECGNTGARADMISCFNAATSDDLDNVKTYFDGLPEADAGYQKAILGAVANQISPDSVFAAEYPGLDDATFNGALKVYYIVGAFGAYVVPYIEHAFDTVTDRTLADACYAQLHTSIGYSAGEDLALLIAQNGEALFGNDGLKSAACFGGSDNAGTDCAATNFAAVTIAGESVTYTDCAAVITAMDEELVEAEADVSRLEVEVTTPGSDASPAAALTTLIAAVALML